MSVLTTCPNGDRWGRRKVGLTNEALTNVALADGRGRRYKTAIGRRLLPWPVPCRALAINSSRGKLFGATRAGGA